ncbi:MAG TPA: hypothetical protein PKL15_07260 [Saprospiraceae bacterium]|nr:hypothetical protein [Saprospiraceae bacterium]HNL39521.1 hypothetical protein [Saprospiraceae bacterium]HNM25211.1 hypothetical protein [Saprospiraceae bacterium]
MKTIAGIALLALAAFFIYRFDIKADPSGAITSAQLKAGDRDSLPQTGLIADPSGVAIVKAMNTRP